MRNIVIGNSRRLVALMVLVRPREVDRCIHLLGCRLAGYAAESPLIVT
jgi:hypothetical protein